MESIGINLLAHIIIIILASFIASIFWESSGNH
jgi:hypothetical protein